MLYLVPSPIGNLADITYRAVDILKEVDFILAEDTRNSSRLLQHYGIVKPLSPYHQHNEHKITEHIIAQLKAGKRIALITDAGTPGISDPGFLLVRACLAAGEDVQCLPGATAFVPALVNSGLPLSQFAFYGFPPLKKGRQTFFTSLKEDDKTMVFYESPMRLGRTLQDMIKYYGPDRLCCVSRELTKLFEENKRGTLQEVADHFASKTVKGEIVIVLQGKN